MTFIGTPLEELYNLNRKFNIHRTKRYRILATATAHMKWVRSWMVHWRSGGRNWEIWHEKKMDYIYIYYNMIIKKLYIYIYIYIYIHTYIYPYKSDIPRKWYYSLLCQRVASCKLTWISVWSLKQLILKQSHPASSSHFPHRTHLDKKTTIANPPSMLILGNGQRLLRIRSWTRCWCVSPNVPAVVVPGRPRNRSSSTCQFANAQEVSRDTLAVCRAALDR